MTGTATRPGNQREDTGAARCPAVITAGRPGFWDELTGAVGDGVPEVIADLRSLLLLDPADMQMLAVVAACARLRGRRLGAACTGRAADQFRAAGLDVSLDLAATPGQLAGQWSQR